MSQSESWRHVKIRSLLESDCACLSELRAQFWNGSSPIDPSMRLRCWQLFFACIPTDKVAREEFELEHEKKYEALVEAQSELMSLTLDDLQNLGPEESLKKTLRQIRLDLPRTFTMSAVADAIIDLCPSVGRDEALKLGRQICERVLFVWSCENPELSYIQGFNEIVVPMIVVSLRGTVGVSTSDSPVSETADADFQMVLKLAESRAYYLFSRLLVYLADAFFDEHHEGVLSAVNLISKHVQRIEPELIRHLEQFDISMGVVCFKWLSCLMARELPLRCLLRLWDALFTEPQIICRFLPYVCVAILIHFKGLLVRLDASGISDFLQQPATEKWTPDTIDSVLAFAYVLRQMLDSNPGSFK